MVHRKKNQECKWNVVGHSRIKVGGLFAGRVAKKTNFMDNCQIKMTKQQSFFFVCTILAVFIPIF